MSEKTARQKVKEIAREYFQKNIDNVSTGTEGFPDASSFIYGFMEGYQEAGKDSSTAVSGDVDKIRLTYCEKALKSYQRSGDLIEANKLAWEYFSKYRDIS